MDKVCLFGCSVTTGFGAATKTACIEAGSTVVFIYKKMILFPIFPQVAVFGLGAVGLSVIQGAKACSAKTILAIDINPKKFALGRERHFLYFD